MHYHENAIAAKKESYLNEIYKRVADYREQKLQRIMGLSDPSRFNYLYVFYMMIGCVSKNPKQRCAELEGFIQSELASS